MADAIRRDDPEITLTTQEIARLNELTGGGERDYWKGYLYVRGLLEARGEGSGDRHVWFDRAAGINRGDARMLATDAGSLFIRAVTEFGLALDGETPPLSVQQISDTIGDNVINDILNNGVVPSLNAILAKDVQAALRAGHQTIGGWGGAFYYWNAPIGENKEGKTETVGQRILGSPRELEKFIAVNAAALNRTVQSERLHQPLADKEFLTMALFGAAASLPDALKRQILVRAASVGQGGSYLGDADAIDGFDRDQASGIWRRKVTTFSASGARAMWQTASPERAELLDQRREYRLSRAAQARFTLDQGPGFGATPPADPDAIGIYRYDHLDQRWRYVRPNDVAAEVPEDAVTYLDRGRQRRLEAVREWSERLEQPAPEPKRGSGRILKRAARLRIDKGVASEPAERPAPPPRPADGEADRPTLGRQAEAQHRPQRPARSEPRQTDPLDPPPASRRRKPVAAKPAETMADERKNPASEPTDPPRMVEREVAAPKQPAPFASMPERAPKPIATPKKIVAPEFNPPQPSVPNPLGPKPRRPAADQRRREIIDAVGGDARFGEMKKWMRAALPEPDRQRIDADLDGDDPETMMRSAAEAYQRFESASPPQRQPKPAQRRKPDEEDARKNEMRKNRAPGDGVFLSPMQVVEEMRRGEYKSDPHYRSEIQKKLGRSPVFRR